MRDGREHVREGERERKYKERSMPQTITWKHLGLVLCMVVAWGANVTAVKVVVAHGAGPLTLAAIRFTLALMVVSAWVRRQKIDLAWRWSEAVLLVVITLLFVLQIYTFNLSTRYTTSGRVGVILNAYPFWVALAAGYFFVQDRLTWRRITGSLLATAGVLAVFRESFQGDRLLFTGDLVVFVSSLILTAGIIVQKKAFNAGLDPMRILFYQLVLGVPLYWGGALVFESPAAFPLGGADIAAVLYQGLLVGGASFITWQYMLQKYPASQLSSCFYLVPFFAVLFGYLLLGEPVTWGLGLGLMLVSAGIYFGNK
jgi:drug/metabolite transporter (DMT)-like permease